MKGVVMPYVMLLVIFLLKYYLVVVDLLKLCLILLEEHLDIDGGTVHARELSTIVLKPCNGHFRQVDSYEVVLDCDIHTLQIGWAALHGDFRRKNSSIKYDKVGDEGSSIALDPITPSRDYVLYQGKAFSKGTLMDSMELNILRSESTSYDLKAGTTIACKRVRIHADQSTAIRGRAFLLRWEIDGKQVAEFELSQRTMGTSWVEYVDDWSPHPAISGEGRFHCSGFTYELSDGR